MHDPGPRLTEAAPFISQFAKQHVVVKLGGELFDHAPVLERIAPQVAILYQCGLRPVVVHGGGKQIDLRCDKRGIAIDKRHGRRVTSKAVLEVVLDVVARELNHRFCELLSERGVPVSGFADGISQAVNCAKRPPVEIDGETVDFGEVGDIQRIDGRLLRTSPQGQNGVVPILPCIGRLADGAWVNVNADSIAARVAITLGAQKLVMLSAVPGVLESNDAVGPISQLSAKQTRRLMQTEAVTGGMLAKLQEALVALDGHVPQVHIISGVEPHTLLREIFTEEGCGTLVTRGAEG